VLAGPTLEAARALLGAHLVRDGAARRVGRIVEVEAYIGEDDQASHARFGRTARNAVMFGPPGIAYVYLVYGMHDCLNVVTEPAGRPAAVLIRAVETIEGVEAVRAARIAVATRPRKAAIDPAVTAARIARLGADRLAAGPALVAAGFDITRADTGVDLLDPSRALRIEQGTAPRVVQATPRLGIAYAGEPWRSSPWRFVDPASPAISGPRQQRGSAA
jgi:DNA-3-methyladenine glycosylase